MTFQEAAERLTRDLAANPRVAGVTMARYTDTGNHYLLVRLTPGDGLTSLPSEAYGYPVVPLFDAPDTI